MARVVAVLAIVSAFAIGSSDASGGPPPAAPPDLVAVVDAFGLAPLRTLARRGGAMLRDVLGHETQLAEAVDALTSRETNGFHMNGVAGEAPVVAWDFDEYRRPLRAPADFRFRAQAVHHDGTRSVSAAFKTVVTASPAATLEFAERLIEAFHAGDGAVMQAFRRDFPAVAEVAGRVVDLDAVTLVEPGEDYDTLRMRFPFDRRAIGRHYPTLGTLIRFLHVAETTVTDGAGRVAFRTRLDNGEGTFELTAFSRGRSLLWSDGERPLRDAAGRPVPIELDLAGRARYEALIEAEAALFKVGGLALASFGLPDSRWDLRYEGGEGGSRAVWSLRLAELGAPNRFLALLLPLGKIHEMLVRTFSFVLATKPSTESAPGDGPPLYELGMDFGVELPRFSILDLVQDVTRWLARSRTVTDALRLLRDIADGGASDLEAALGREA